ncbi:MAG TPA: FTR1 family protein [Alphaproteobacteria bacterium]|jgi:high-affinity iron transporter|nr:FTR1 family protein [Alphaproteobacteria bacterium]HRK98233.1 FTR1 family protein [Alphaproteobacteria bacterium]
MIETALITLRESLEAFLIIAIMIAYLTQTGRKNLTPAVYAGLICAVLLSGILGYAIQDMIENPIAEGGMALVSGLLVATMTFHVMKTAKNIKKSITSKMDHHVGKSTYAASIGLFLFTVLMVSREGMETALMLGSLTEETNATLLFTGAFVGIAATGVIGYIWIKHSKSINLRLFLQTTGIFLIVFALHLFVYGIHELSEMNVIPFIDNTPIHIATEPFGHDSPVAQFVLYAMVGVPCLWLAGSIIKDKLTQFQPART